MVKPYQLELRPEAIVDLSRIEKPQAQRILNKLKWFTENFGLLKPLPLTGKAVGLSGFGSEIIAPFMPSMRPVSD